MTASFSSISSNSAAATHQVRVYGRFLLMPRLVTIGDSLVSLPQLLLDFVPPRRQNPDDSDDESVTSDPPFYMHSEEPSEHYTEPYGYKEFSSKYPPHAASA